MICISVFVEDFSHAVEAIKRYGKKISLVELRLDRANTEIIEQAVGQITRPIVFTCRPKEQGGLFQGKESERVELLEKVIRFRPLYLDVELGSRAESLIDRYPDQPFILSFHSPSLPLHRMQSTMRRAIRRKTAYVKFVTVAETWLDNLNAVKIVKSFNGESVGVICFCTGEKGLYSRLMSLGAGAPFGMFTVRGAQPTGDGQITVEEALDVYHVERIDSSSAVFGIAGNPIDHSLSPQLHNALFKEYGIKAIYLPFKVEDYNEFHTFLREAEIRGLSITSPHKVSAARAVANVDDITARCGACNTLLLENNDYRAFNTDGPGFLKALVDRIGLIKKKKVFVIGPGAAGRAIAYSLIEAGADVTVCGRSPASLEEVARNLGCNVTCGQKELINADIVINATTIAEFSDDTNGFLSDMVPMGCLAIDLHYAPEVPLFLREASLKACETMNGLNMFCNQAALQFKIWTGIEPDEEKIRTIVS